MLNFFFDNFTEFLSAHLRGGGGYTVSLACSQFLVCVFFLNFCVRFEF